MLFITVKTSGLEQQVTDHCPANDAVAAQPVTAKRYLRCRDDQAKSVRCDVLGYAGGPVAVVATCVELRICWTTLGRVFRRT